MSYLLIKKTTADDDDDDDDDEGLCPAVAYRGIVLGDSDQTYHIHVISIGGGLCNMFFVAYRPPQTRSFYTAHRPRVRLGSGTQD